MIAEGFGDRDTVAEKMLENGIQTRLTFKALHTQPVFSDSGDPRFPDVDGRYPVSENLSQNGLCLPSGLNLTRADIDQVVTQLFNALNG